jgi:RNA recognition motif-containing protein
MVRTKVFVGNLSFKTREAELAQEFASAGNVIGANIITRGPRSLGYGFVEFDSEEEANKSVTIMNKKEIDGRAINVEVAKPREDENTSEQQTNGSPNNTNNNNSTSPRGGFRGRGRGGRGGFRGGFRGGRGGNVDGGSGGFRGGFRGGRGGFRGGRGGYRRRFDNDNTENAGNNENNTNNQERPPRRFNRRENQGPDTRTESKTTLFIANLPFSLDDAAFGEVFTSNGLKFKTAHVVQKRNGRSKGFGFAEFDSEVDQQKALEALNQKKVEERELIVKVALTEQNGENNNNNNTNNNNTNNTNTPATTTTTTTKKEETPASEEKK